MPCEYITCLFCTSRDWVTQCVVRNSRIILQKSKHNTQKKTMGIYIHVRREILFTEQF